MARPKSGLFDNKQYQNEYHRSMKKILLSFNQTSTDDMSIWNHLQKKNNKTKYIKGLIREDMSKES